MQHLFAKTFPLDGKIKLSVTGVSKNERKKKVSTSQKISFHQQELGYFSKTEFALAEKNLQIKQYCFK